uniref:Ig-like domain-containing protein n=1 Tax=Gallus gallus TaxID=9031 RepID=A0A8V0XKF5_CHICK
MAPMAVALILGWWLVAASRAQQLPRPSLSLHPSQGVSLGDNVTLRCHLPRPAAWVWLYLEGRWSYAKYIDKKQDTTEFSFLSASHDQAGTYLCQYQVSESEDVSVMSDPVELVLTGEDTGTVDSSLSSQQDRDPLLSTPSCRSQFPPTSYLHSPRGTCGDRDQCHHPLLEQGLWGRLPPAQGWTLRSYPAPGPR